MPDFPEALKTGGSEAVSEQVEEGAEGSQAFVDWVAWLDSAQRDSLGCFWLTGALPGCSRDAGVDTRKPTRGEPGGEAPPYPNNGETAWLLGRVCGDLGTEYRVRLPRETRLARFTGAFTSDNRPVIGDYVLLEAREVRAARLAQASGLARGQGEAYLPAFSHVLPRRNCVTRTLPFRRTPQPLASNVTHVMLVVGSDDNRHGLLAEQVRRVAETHVLPALALVTKTDVVASDYWKILLRSLGFEQILEGANSPEGRQTLLESCMGMRTSLLLIGPSGAGKSTLTNHLIGRGEREVGSVGRRGLGRHQSTTREAFLVAGERFVIDSPGVRTLAG